MRRLETSKFSSGSHQNTSERNFQNTGETSNEVALFSRTLSRLTVDSEAQRRAFSVRLGRSLRVSEKAAFNVLRSQTEFLEGEHLESGRPQTPSRQPADFHHLALQPSPPSSPALLLGS